MTLRLILGLYILLQIQSVTAQDKVLYYQYAREAWRLNQAENFKASADTYKMAFDLLNGKAEPNDRYNAACSYALANDIENAFYHLLKLAEGETKYRKYEHITTDPDLFALHKDERWIKLTARVKQNKIDFENNLDQDLVSKLKVIYDLDQKYRKEVQGVIKEKGSESDDIKKYWSLIKQADSINLKQIKNILDKHGWLGETKVGKQGNITLFLVIQHSDLETQIKYLPMMRKAALNGNAKLQNVAYLEDRIAVSQNKRQIYGSQISRDEKTGKLFVYPMIEPETVNIRRMEMGLNTIEDFLNYYDIIWDIDEHKKRTRRMESKYGGF